VRAWPCRLPPHISAGLSRRATPTPRSRNPKEAISASYADAMKSSLLRVSVPARYTLDRTHPLQVPCGGRAVRSGFRAFLFIVDFRYMPAVEAVGMWESQRDFQRMWEGWKACFLAFYTFHILSFPWPALECVFKERSYRKPFVGKLRQCAPGAVLLTHNPTWPRTLSRWVDSYT
jgi:hypothetical protein